MRIRALLRVWLVDDWMENAVLLLPIINAFATILTTYFIGSSLNPGVLRGVFILVFSFFFLSKNFVSQGWMSFWVYANLLYFFIICFFSSDWSVSFNSYLKYYVSVVHFLFGLYYSRREGFINRLSISILLMLTIYMLDFLLANLFGYGGVSYSGVENSLNFGGLGVNLAKSVSMILMLFPFLFLLFHQSKRKWILYLLIVISVLFILFAFKRSAMLGTVIGFLIIAFTYPSRGKIIKFSIGLGVFSILSAPVYIDQVIDNFKAREEAIDLRSEENREKQARYLEYFRVTDAWIDGSWKHRLIGSEMFNDCHYYRVKRMLHTDYMTILSGGGAIGFFIFIGLYSSIIIFFSRAYLSDSGRLTKVYSGIVIAMTVTMLVFGGAGIIHGVEPRGTYFLLVGGFVAYHERRRLRDKFKYLQNV
jgi:hypothetical protein